MQNSYLAPWRRRHPAAFVVIAIAVVSTLILTVALGTAIGAVVLLAHALSDPIPVDPRDAATVRERVRMYGEALDRGWGVAGSQCTGFADAEAAKRWFPPAPRYAGSVRIDGDEATVIVSSTPNAATAETVAALSFRYEDGAWRYCGVS